jgi:putative sugar O-methyltransferase
VLSNEAIRGEEVIASSQSSPQDRVGFVDTKTRQRTSASSSIQEDTALLAEMINAARDQSALYQPGPYWESKTKAAAGQIRRHGLDEFRGDRSGVATSFSDNVVTDVRTELDTRMGRPLKFLLERVFPFSRVMDTQVDLTRGYARDELALTAARIAASQKTRDLLARYEMPDSLLGGCIATAEIDGQEISLHYLRALQLIDRVRRVLDGARSLFEIGGGFGANVHLMAENFPICKFVYLDVVPNLYVGTCYLRTLYGDSVRDFSETRELEQIAFKDDDELEIIAICPWQVEALELPVDVFWNASSFVEMPREVVANYAQHVLRLGANTIVLSTYGGGGRDTLEPSLLPDFFPEREFAKERFWSLGRPLDARTDRERDANWEVSLFVSQAS